MLVPCTYHATILTGPRAGQTLVNQVPAQSGFIGEDARTIVLGQPGPVVESVAIWGRGQDHCRISAETSCDRLA
jgi:hypothetical protein